MSEHFLLYVVFASQVFVISYLLPLKLRLRASEIMANYPPDEYPKLYPLSVEKIEKKINQLEKKIEEKEKEVNEFDFNSNPESNNNKTNTKVYFLPDTHPKAHPRGIKHRRLPSCPCSSSSFELNGPENQGTAVFIIRKIR